MYSIEKTRHGSKATDINREVVSDAFLLLLAERGIVFQLIISTPFKGINELLLASN